MAYPNKCSRRAYGQGWTSKTRNSKGLWVGIVDLGVGIDGRRVRKTVKAKTKAERLAKMDAAREGRAKGLPAFNQSTTTETWLRYWLDNVKAGQVSDDTLDSYRRRVEGIIPYVGKLPLLKLGPEHVIRMLGLLEAKGWAPRTIALSRSILRMALADAERWGVVPRNVASLVRSPARNATRLDDALDAEQAELVLEQAKGERLEALAVLVLATGLRQGEALRLRWDDLDLVRGSVTVRKSKTEAGRRTIALPTFAVTALKAHRRRQREERLAALMWGDPGLVFTTAFGEQIPRRDALRWWHKMTEQAGVGRRRFHASRPTAATLMLNSGVPLEVVSKTLGHAGLAITADVYAKVRPELQRTAADAMETVLGSR